MNAKELRDVAENLFSKKAPLNSLHQEIADHFYPERANFTITRSVGADFASQLMTSYPVRARRDLGNQFSTMLRPTARPWFHLKRRHEDKEEQDNEMKVWLQWMEETQRRAMYDPATLFTRSTKEGDHDFAAFGQCVISVEMNRAADALIYRTWHLRDCAWQENEEGKIGFFVRKWKPTARTLVRTFGASVDDKIARMAEKSPFEEIECMHFVVESDLYDKSTTAPRWSIWYDIANDHVMETTPLHGRHYIVPRWQTVSGSQYSYSPATVCALPDARLIQAMTYTLLEVGEKAAQPPMIATQNVIRSDLGLYAGGVTWVDEEYDERLGAALRPIEQDFRGVTYGLQMNQDTRQMIHSAFFLDALTLPQRAPEMTAYEVGQRVQEYVRSALPLFEPLEMEYNAAICEETFALLLRHGTFGAPQSWPAKLRGADVDFTFESPLHDAIEQQKGQQFTEAMQLLGQAIAMDPSAQYVPKTEVALREALIGVGVPAKWLNTESYVADQKANQEQQTAQAQQLANLESASKAAANIGQSGMVPAVPSAGPM